MVHYKLNPQVIIFLSLVVFLLLKQSHSKAENAPNQLVKDSKLVTSRKIDLFGESSEEEKKAGKNEVSKKEKKEKKEKKKKKKKEEKERVHKNNKLCKKKKNEKKNSSSSASNTFSSTESLLHLSRVIRKYSRIPPEITEGCMKADNPRVCEATLLSLVKDTHNLDASIIFELSSEALRQALKTAKMSLGDQEMGVNEKAASVCDQSYEDGLDAMKGAFVAAIVDKDRYMALLKLSTVITDIDTCQDAVSGDGNKKLDLLNMVLYKLASNAISLGDAAMQHNVN